MTNIFHLENTHMRRLILTCLALFPLALSAQAQMPPPPARTITMQGQGSVSVVPDQATITIGVQSFAPKPEDALAQNSKAMTKVIGGLKSAGLAEKDIGTTDFAVNPRMTYVENQPPRVEGFEVSNNVRVTLRDLTKLGRLLAAAVGDGSNAINGLSLDVSDPSPLLDEARRSAFADASRRANAYAQAAGLKLAEVLSITEPGSEITPRPIMARMAMARSQDAVPVSLGEQRLEATVSVTWRLE
jgi:uncharacterized protein YggE